MHKKVWPQQGMRENKVAEMNLWIQVHQPKSAPKKGRDGSPSPSLTKNQTADVVPVWGWDPSCCPELQWLNCLLKVDGEEKKEDWDSGGQKDNSFLGKLTSAY